MELKKILTPRKLRRVKANFAEYYDSLPRNRQPEFRHAVMSSQKWQSTNRFYQIIKGRCWAKQSTIDDIRSIFQQFGVEIN